MQNYNNVPKKKLNCFKFEPVEPAEESKRILRNLYNILNTKAKV
jgi:hypothetical protein